MALDVLLRSAVRRAAGTARRKQLLDLAELTLDHMAMGGIYDQLGGGIHRYSTDVEWHVPHFEKMLYDQALVSRIYLDAFQLLSKPLYGRIARGILDYVLADLPVARRRLLQHARRGQRGRRGQVLRLDARRGPGGRWTREDGELFCAHYDVSESGNWHDPHDPQHAEKRAA